MRAGADVDFVPVTQQMLEHPDPADWLMMSRTYDAQHFSPLNQINKSNVAQLRMAWSRGLPERHAGIDADRLSRRDVSLRARRRHQAVDATTGDQIWEYKRDYPRQRQAKRARNKSLAIYEDMIYFAAPDGVPARARRQDRQGALGDQGRQWRPDGGRTDRRRRQGDLQPHLRAGQARKLLHRRPRREDRQGAVEVLRTAAPGEPGGDTWADMPVNERTAGPWGLPGSYDPKRKVLYWGVANPDPYTRLTRHGRPDAVSLTAPANLYSNSTVALDVNTGKLVWYYQELPGDDWDTDHNHERVLVHTKVSPDPKHVKWISSTIAPGQERDMVVTVSEGGGCSRSTRPPAISCGRCRFPTTTRTSA